MSYHIDTQGRLHHDTEGGESLVLTCPLCQLHAHATVLAVPAFAELAAQRPRQIGVIVRCDACRGHLFLRFVARHFGADRIELSAQFSEVERAPEKFDFHYLPAGIEVLFREALRCHAALLPNAFVAMCRRTMQALFADQGDAGRLRMFDQLNEVRQMAALDADTCGQIRRVLFDTDNGVHAPLPVLDDLRAGVLLEVMKDLLYEAYVRRGRLQQAMRQRQSCRSP